MFNSYFKLYDFNVDIYDININIVDIKYNVKIYYDSVEPKGPSCHCFMKMTNLMMSIKNYIEFIYNFIFLFKFFELAREEGENF
jgi:hypothetical protein